MYEVVQSGVMLDSIGLMVGRRLSHRFLEKARRWCVGLMVLWSVEAVLCCIAGGSVAAQSGPVGVSSVQARRQFNALGGMLERFQTDSKVRRRWEVVAGEVFESESLLRADDRDPVDVVLRRTETLLRHIRSMAGRVVCRLKRAGSVNCRGTMRSWALKTPTGGIGSSSNCSD